MRTDGPDDGGEDQTRHTSDEPDGQQRAHHVGQGADPGQARGIGEHIGNDADPTYPDGGDGGDHVCAFLGSNAGSSGPLCPSVNGRPRLAPSGYRLIRGAGSPKGRRQ